MYYKLKLRRAKNAKMDASLQLIAALNMVNIKGVPGPFLT